MQRSSSFLLVAALVVVGLSVKPIEVRAAQSYSNCTGFINALPAVISTPGTWCLKKDLATSMSSGRVISIAADDVTIDCNDFKIGGLAAGAGSNATAISTALGSINSNTTIRNCNIRGFGTGISLTGGGVHLVEDNRLDNNLYSGVAIEGVNANVHNNNIVRRNIIQTIGGGTSSRDIYGIYAEADIHDNTVADLESFRRDRSVHGIFIYGVGTSARNNTVRNLRGNKELMDSGRTWGILVDSARVRLDGNHIVGGSSSALGAGIRGSTKGAAFCIGNTVASFSEGIGNCQLISGNKSY